jgi:hypothetical protein
MAETEATTTIEIEDMITVGTLAERLSIPVSRLIAELMKNGVMATVNERIDFDTAQIIVEELGLGLTLAKRQSEEELPVRHKAQASAKAQPRPPVLPSTFLPTKLTTATGRLLFWIRRAMRPLRPFANTAPC